MSSAACQKVLQFFIDGMAKIDPFEDKEASLLGGKDTKNKDISRYETLIEIWKLADTDGSDSLQREEVEQVILHLFNIESLNLSQELPQASKMTDLEIKSETRHLISLLDVSIRALWCVILCLVI